MIRRLLRRLKGALVRALDASASRDSPLTVPVMRVLALSRDPRFHRPARVTLEWLDEARCGDRTTIQPAGEGWSYGPKIRGRQEVQRTSLPALARYEFRDARVSAASSSVLCADRLLVARTSGVDVSRCNYAAGHLLAHGERTAIVACGPEERIDAGVFLGGNGAFNYYHWMLELLPKLQFVDDAERPLLVSDDVARMPTFQEALLRVAEAREIVLLRQDTTYRVSRLLHVDSPTSCPFNLRGGERFRLRDFLFRPASIEFLRSRLLGPSQGSASSARRRLFLARKPLRRNYNQDEVFALFERRGFEQLYMEDLSLTEQIEAVAGAEVIAGPTGAAWTNLLFAGCGTRCLCWMATEQSGFAAYSNLAHAVGADLHYLTYETGVNDTGRLYFMDYRLDPAEVERQLNDLA
jgi:capsular polysaccharide biosynthesis protein